MGVETHSSGVHEGVQGHRERSVPAFRIALPLPERRALLIVGDTLLVNGVVLVALWLWAKVGGEPFDSDFIRVRWYWFPVLSIAWWCLAWLGDLYDIPMASRRIEVSGRVGGVILGLGVIYLVVYFLSPRNALPRVFFLYFSILALICLVLWRWTYATIFALPLLRRRLLIVGAGWAGQTLAQVLSAQDSVGYQVVGFVDDDPAKQGEAAVGLPVLGLGTNLVDIVQTHQVDKVVVAVTHDWQGELFQALMDCRSRGTDIARMPELYEQLTRRVPVEHVDKGWVLGALNGFSALGRLERAVRRLLDLVLGLLGSLGLGIALPLVALAVRLDDNGPIFYTQVRSGLGGRPFRAIKFRTMRPDAEEDGHAQWARENDDRVTRVGRLLRKIRLDELPQVINVLRGEMSIVGPRPERPEFIADLEKQIPFYRTRLVVKPGLTGWAQIHYGYGNSVRDALIKLQYDLYYIRHRSLWLDLYIVFKTVGVVLSGIGM